MLRLTRGLWLVWLGIVLTGPAGASAQGTSIGVTLDPAMIKGPATAPVTIVEFSDYQ